MNINHLITLNNVTVSSSQTLRFIFEIRKWPNETGTIYIFFYIYTCSSVINSITRCFVEQKVNLLVILFSHQIRGRRGRDGMVFRFTTTYAISAYHHICYEFESRSWRGVQHYVINFVSDFRHVGGFLRVLHQ